MHPEPCTPWRRGSQGLHSYLTESVHQVVLRKSIPAKKHQLILGISSRKGCVDEYVGELTSAKRLQNHFLRNKSAPPTHLAANASHNRAYVVHGIIAREARHKSAKSPIFTSKRQFHAQSQFSQRNSLFHARSQFCTSLAWICGQRTPYTLHSTLFILNPTPYTLHPTTYSLHPIPYTLHPTP